MILWKAWSFLQHTTRKPHTNSICQNALNRATVKKQQQVSGLFDWVCSSHSFTQSLSLLCKMLHDFLNECFEKFLTLHLCISNWCCWSVVLLWIASGFQSSFWLLLCGCVVFCRPLASVYVTPAHTVLTTLTILKTLVTVVKPWFCLKKNNIQKLLPWFIFIKGIEILQNTLA